MVAFFDVDQLAYWISVAAPKRPCHELLRLESEIALYSNVVSCARRASETWDGFDPDQCTHGL